MARHETVEALHTHTHTHTHTQPISSKNCWTVWRESYSLEESVSKASVVCSVNKYVKLKSYI